MKAIIISDSDARALLDKLKLAALTSDNIMMTMRTHEDPAYQSVVSEVHRAFHYIVCSWRQEQGADCVGR